MAAPTRYTGKDLYVEFGGVDLTTGQRAFSVSREQETADTTAGADDARSFKATVKAYTATLEVLADSSTAGTALLAAIKEGTEGTLIWGALGTTAGLPKSSFPAIVNSVAVTLNFDDASVYSVEFQGQGAMVEDELLGSVWS